MDRAQDAGSEASAKPGSLEALLLQDSIRRHDGAADVEIDLRDFARSNTIPSDNEIGLRIARALGFRETRSQPTPQLAESTTAVSSEKPSTRAIRLKEINIGSRRRRRISSAGASESESKTKMLSERFLSGWPNIDATSNKVSQWWSARKER